MELKQYLKMSQQLVMTPQLQQAIKLLQLSRIELEEQVQQELLENPILEMETEARSPDEVLQAINHGPDEEAAHDRVEAGTSEKQDDFDYEGFVSDYADYSSNPAGNDVRLSDDEMPTIEQTLSQKTTLADHLEWQLHMIQLLDEERSLAIAIIGNLDDDGYITREVLQQIAEEQRVELADLEQILVEVIQQLDPIGVGARDVKECLLLQAKHYFPKDDLVHQIIERHLERLEKKQIPPILKDLDCDMEDLQGAMVLIRELEPKPGRNFAGSGEEPQYVTPDVAIIKVDDEYIVQLNEDGLPKLKISNFYQNQIKAQGKSADKREKDFIQDKFKSAVWLIRSIHQRQSTIRKVTESIVRFQREFLDRGGEHLRPLILRDVADDIGMHESTISRVTTNKYVHTPQGIFELKYFFNSRIQSNQGADLASESVKQKIKKYIGEEDEKKPLSDQKLCEMLEAEGMTIARRTVAKYREMMNIPPSSERKKVL
jgi:RNA polymerase sigma-54 factor